MKTSLYRISLFLIFFLIWNISSYCQSPFITTWQTTEPNESITIPTHPDETYDYDVDWGDGNVTYGHNEDATHSYEVVGEYVVSITGLFPRISFYYSKQANRDKIKSIDQWGSLNWTSMERAFYKCHELSGQANDSPNLSKCPSLRGMFEYASSFNQYIGDWDVSSVLNMQDMFFEANSFNQDISNWEVSNVIDMSGMFFFDSLFNQDIGNWDVSNVQNMRGMFFGASAFNQDIGRWDVSNVTNMANLFAKNPCFNQKIGSWNTSNVTNMHSAFQESISFNQDIGNWDMSNVSNMGGMFFGASAFNQDIGRWDVSNVTNMAWLFCGAKKFNQDISNWDVKNVIVMTSMFYDAVNFDINIGSWDVSSVINMDLMFQGASSFNSDISSWDVTNVNSMWKMFYKTKQFDQNLGLWNIESVTEMRDMLYRTNLSTANYDSTLFGWSNQQLQPNIEFDGGNSTYCNAESARQYIIDSYGWTITDGGKDEDCVTSFSGISYEEFYIYPNPTSSVIHLSDSFPFDKIKEFVVRDAMGISHGIEIKADRTFLLPRVNGLYFILIQLDDGTRYYWKVLMIN